MKRTLIFFTLIVVFAGCDLWYPQTPATDKIDVFNELYHVLDENYVFFNYKDIDWSQTYSNYLPQVTNDMSDSAFFDLMSQFVNELKDGHTRIHNGTDVSHYDFTYGFAANVDRDILDAHLGNDIRSSGKIIYTALDDIGYVYIPNFWDGNEHEPFDSILTLFSDKRGLIIDIRNNGGGSNYSCKRIASHFTSETYLGERWYVKNGPDHNDVRLMSEISVEPGAGVPFYKPVALLTNRSVYSSANDFTNLMEQNPHVILVGDTTGGGGGVPRQYILSNNWNLFYCDTYTLNAAGEHLENGIAPDIRVDLDTLVTDTDEILAAALQALRQQ